MAAVAHVRPDRWDIADAAIHLLGAAVVLIGSPSRPRLVAQSITSMPATPAADGNLPVNINYVFGMSDAAPQSFMPGSMWFAMLLIGLPAIIFYPTHRLLLRYVANGPRTSV